MDTKHYFDTKQLINTSVICNYWWDTDINVSNFFVLLVLVNEWKYLQIPLQNRDCGDKFWGSTNLTRWLFIIQIYFSDYRVLIFFAYYIFSRVVQLFKVHEAVWIRSRFSLRGQMHIEKNNKMEIVLSKLFHLAFIIKYFEYTN